MRTRHFCRNPHCGDWVPGGSVFPLCVSCRYAGRLGAAAAFGVFLVGHVLAEIEWLPIVKLALGAVFN